MRNHLNFGVWVHVNIRGVLVDAHRLVLILHPLHAWPLWLRNEGGKALSRDTVDGSRSLAACVVDFEEVAIQPIAIDPD